MVVGLGHRKCSWVFAFNKDLVLDQQFILSARWSACSRYIEFRGLRISELSCTHYNENAGKPWIRQSFFRQCFKITISPKIFTAKVLFYTVYVAGLPVPKVQITQSCVSSYKHSGIVSYVLRIYDSGVFCHTHTHDIIVSTLCHGLIHEGSPP